MKDRSNIVRMYLPRAAKHSDAVLEQALGDYEALIILGWNKQGDMDVRATTTLGHAEVLWLAQLLTHKLLAGDFADG